MKKFIISHDELSKQPHGLVDAILSYNLTKRGFNPKRKIFGHSEIKTKNTIYAQHSLLEATLITTFNFVTTMFDPRGLLK